jgi:hypothetical protein
VRSNNRVKPTGEAVTGLAKDASPAPASPAAYAERWGDNNGTTS